MTETPTTQSYGVVNFAQGTFTSDGTATTVTLGFKPRHIKVFNETDVILWEKFLEQAAANTVKTVAAGTMTKDTTSAITIATDESTFVINAGASGTAKVLHWVAFA